jgi:D-inositol-3-phosphate glycosyltransferase
VSAYSHPHVGGVEVIVAQQAQTLARLNYRVTVLTSRIPAGAPAREETAGVTVIRAPAWNGLENRSGIALPIWSPGSLARMAALVRRSDIVHVHDVYHPASLIAAGAARILRRPFFLTQHVGIVEHPSGLVKGIQRLIYATTGRLLYRWASAITVYNPIVRTLAIRYGAAPGKIRLTSNGIDTAFFCPGSPGETAATRRRYQLPTSLPLVLFAGRLVPKKGFGQLMASRGPEYHIAIAGPGQVPAEVPPGVTFVGAVGRDDLRSLYRAADVFAFPAVGEMLTLTMQEAMACGLPVVTTAENAYDDYDLDRSRLALVAPEPQALRSALLSIIASEDRRREMGSYSRRLAQERFSWQQNSRALAADYARALAPVPAPWAGPGPDATRNGCG